MIRQRLRDMDFKITELSDYLQITRPTLYKFIEDFDGGNTKAVNKRVLKLFVYIESHPLAGKKTVLAYILTHFVVEQEMEEGETASKLNKIRKYVLENPDSDKTKFIELILSRKDFDLIIAYLLDMYPLLKKRKLSDEEITKLKPYDDLINEIDKEGH